MGINRDIHLQKLIEGKHNGMIKMNLFEFLMNENSLSV